MTAATLMSENKARGIVRARSSLCEFGCGRPASDYAHRVPRSHGKYWHPSNALRACHRCHMASEKRRTLSYSMGWLIRTGADPEPWLATPAKLQIENWPEPAWWIPTADGLFEFVPDEDVPAGLDIKMSLGGALYRLHCSDQELRDLIPAQRAEV